MSDELPKIKPLYERSASYRDIHSNFYRYKVGMGELVIGFGTVRDSFTGPPNTVVEEVTIAMSWQQAKLLSKTLVDAISIIEREVGEVKVPIIPSEIAAKEQAQTITNLRNMFLRKQAPSETEKKAAN